MKTINLVVEVSGGCVRSIHGDECPEDVELSFTVQDHDNISFGNDDPVAEDYIPEVYYW